MFGKKKKDKKEKETKKVDEALKEAIDDNNIKEEVKENKKEEKKEKESSKDKVKFNSSWGALAKIVAGVILVILGFMFIFQKDGNEIYLREKFSIIIFGAILIVYSITRIIYLIKADTKAKVKGLLALEVLFDVVVGLMLFFGGIQLVSSNEGFANFILKYFKYLLGFVFYLRGILYLLSAIFLHHVTNAKEFIINIILLTFGVIIFVRTEFDLASLSWILVGLSFICGAYTLADGSYHYIESKKREDKKKSKKKEKVKEERATKEEKIIINDKDQTTDSKYAN